MITGFLIATLFIFIINIVMNMFVLAISIVASKQIPVITLASLVITLVMLTWNILALISL